MGWALDGYPILGLKDAQGRWRTSADLDACHGRAEPVQVNGHLFHYAYRFTREYPYTLGCFTGDLLAGTQQSIGEQTGHAGSVREAFRAVAGMDHGWSQRRRSVGFRLVTFAVRSDRHRRI